jgi:hypothetical protein
VVEGGEEGGDHVLTPVEQRQVLAPLVRLRQACCHPQVGGEGGGRVGARVGWGCGRGGGTYRSLCGRDGEGGLSGQCLPVGLSCCCRGQGCSIGCRAAL